MMRRSVVVLAAVLCAAGTAFAQAPPSPSHADWQAKRQQWEQKWKAKRAEMEQKRMDRLAVLLDMTPAQKQQVQTIFAGERDQMKQAMKQAMEARKAAHTEARGEAGSGVEPHPDEETQAAHAASASWFHDAGTDGHAWARWAKAARWASGTTAPTMGWVHRHRRLLEVARSKRSAG